MSVRLNFNIRDAEVTFKGIRTGRDKKERPYFQATTKSQDGKVTAFYVSGDTVEVGKKYDLDVMATAKGDEIYLNLQGATEKGTGSSKARL